jgi:hypothetical protein
MLKLKPRQIIGLAAIVVFGGMMIFRLTQPSEREIMEKRLASLPSFTVPASELPPLQLDVPTVTVPTITAPDTVLRTDAGASSTDTRRIYELTGVDYFANGSQAAKDDLYCSGVLSAEFSVRINDSHPDLASIILRDHRALDEAGIAKLIAEGITTQEASAGYSLAYGDKAETDYKAGALRIPVAACTARAAALN